MSGIALSIQQPWAWLICHGYKDIENRTWGTRKRDRVFVHAGKTFDRHGYEWVLRSGLAPVNIPSPSSFPIGGIVGAVTIIGCDSPFEGDTDNPWRDPAQYAFRLVDPVRLPLRPVRGQLGFFHFN